MTTIKSYKKKDGKTYFMFKVYIGVDPLTGKPKDTTRRGFKSRREAEVELGKIQAAISDGTYKKQQVETYQDLYNLWIPIYETTVEESTFVKTTGIFRNHILPTMGNYIITEINVDHCQELVINWSDDLIRFRMVKSYAAKVLDFAITRGYIQTNPFNFVQLPKKVKKRTLNDGEEKKNFYTKDQLIEFLRCMEQEKNIKHFTFFRFSAFSGCRKGEILALTWSDVDFVKNEIRINKALTRGKDNRLYIGPPKAGSSRKIKMDPQTMEILKKWKIQQREDYLVLGFDTLKPKQLVFSNDKNEFLQPTKTREWLERVRKKYNLPKITTHGFRHTAASIMYEAGIREKLISAKLGHASVKMTLDTYTHISDQAIDGAIDKLDEFMNK